MKYNFDDIRNSIERSSARETAARVAAGAIAKLFLREFNIYVGSFVQSIGGIHAKDDFYNQLTQNSIPDHFNAEELNRLSDSSEVRVLDESQGKRIINKIKTAKKKGDTLGGSFCVVVSGVPMGLGSFVTEGDRLDSGLAAAIVGINAVKGVEIGSGVYAAGHFGSESHDELIIKNGIIRRKTNRAGGIEGGISTGEIIYLTGYMKPIATLMKPIKTVDMNSFKEIEARRERSDFVAVPACAVIGESMAAWVIARFFLKKFGGDSIEETKTNFNNYRKYLRKRKIV